MATSGDQELVAKDELAKVGGLDKAEALLAYVEATPDRDSASGILREDPIIGGIGGKRLSKATGVDVARAAKGAMASREDVPAKLAAAVKAAKANGVG